MIARDHIATAALAAVAALGSAGCMVASNSHHEHAFPEHRRWSIGWGLMEAARKYDDAWTGEGQLVVGPLGTFSAGYAPRPTVKLGVETIGSGLVAKGKLVLGHAPPWAGAVVGRFGFLSASDSSAFDNQVSWSARGAYGDASLVLSTGGRRPVPGTSDQGMILWAASAGPKVVVASMSYDHLVSGEEWSGTVVDVGGFAGLSLERTWLRASAEVSLLLAERPATGTRELHPFGGLKLEFRW